MWKHPKFCLPYYLSPSIIPKCWSSLFLQEVNLTDCPISINVRGDAQICFSKNNLSLKELVLSKEPDSKPFKSTRKFLIAKFLCFFSVMEFVLPFPLNHHHYRNVFFFWAILVYFILDFHTNIDPYSSLLADKSPIT